MWGRVTHFSRLRKYLINKRSSFVHNVANSKLALYDYKSKYNEEEQVKILKFLNESSVDDISKLKISQQRLKQILTQREHDGGICSFSSLSAMNGFNVKTMEKMCDRILCTSSDDNLNNPKPAKSKRIRGQVLEPTLIQSNVQKINSVTGIFINYSTVGWSRIEKNPYRITHWDMYNIETDSNKKLHLSSIAKMVWSIYALLPKSDIYVMESEPTVLRSTGAASNNPRMVHVNLQKAQLVAMLSAVINAIGNTTAKSENKDDTQNFRHFIYYIRSTLAPRLFQTLVGNERVSSLYVVENIIKKSNISSEHSVNNHILSFPNAIKTFYSSQNEIKKELLSQTLLLLITFYEVCIFENNDAISKLTNS